MDYLIFDLDGTLSDPQIGITRSINHALAHHGYDTHEQHELVQYIGPPLDETFATIIGDDTRASIADLIATYRERYSTIGYRENTLYDGIIDALQDLQKRGMRMGVCTSKPVKFARPILEMFGLDGYFDFVSGGDVGITKSQQLAALLREGTISKNSLMIGDRAVDITSAQDNGLNSAGVLWGFGSRAEIDAATPDVILEQVAELINLAV